jgi:Bacterial Ig domain
LNGTVHAEQHQPQFVFFSPNFWPIFDWLCETLRSGGFIMPFHPRFIFAGLAALLSACSPPPPAPDTLAPLVILTSSSATVTLTSRITLTATASDDTNVTRVDFFDGALKIGEDSSAPFELRYPITRTQNGSRGFTARAVDAAGNVGTSAEARVDVAVVAPGFYGLGDAGVAPGSSNNERAMVLDRHGNPMTVSIGANQNVIVNRWTGLVWAALGTRLNITDGQSIYFASIAIDSSDHPVVAWVENGTRAANLYVKRWDGTTWVQLGGGSLNINPDRDVRGRESSVSLAVGPDGNPTVAWVESETVTFDNLIYIKRWNGTAWQPLGNAPLNVNITEDASDLSLALEASGNPVVAWIEPSNSRRFFSVHVKRWNNGAWEALGTTVNADRLAYDLSLAIDGNDTPMIAWGGETSMGSVAINVKRWNANKPDWEAVGTALNVNDGYEPALTIDESGNPVVAWSEYPPASLGRIHVKRWGANAWGFLENSTGQALLNVNPTWSATLPTITLDSDGNPIVFWNEYDRNGTRISNNYIKRWNP